MDAIDIAPLAARGSYRALWTLQAAPALSVARGGAGPLAAGADVYVPVLQTLGLTVASTVCVCVCVCVWARGRELRRRCRNRR